MLLRQLRRLENALVHGLAYLSPPLESSPETTWSIPAGCRQRVVVQWPRRYDWRSAPKWMEPVRCGIAQWVEVRRSSIDQPYRHVVLAYALVGAESLPIAIDYNDRPTIDPACVARVAVYFKMQYAQGGYEWSNVVPGGYVPASSLVYHLAPQLRRLRDRREFSYDAYGRFGLNSSQDLRSRAIALLANQRSFHFEGSPAVIPYAEYLREVASAKLCVDLPGNGDFCFRLIDYLAMGACVISVRPRNALHVPLVDREHVVFAKRDLSDLVTLCQYYLEHDEEREALARRGRQYFDRYLHRIHFGAYYISRILTAAKKASKAKGVGSSRSSEAGSPTSAVGDCDSLALSPSG